MFFEGTLQEGINNALQRSKLVICFVTDSGSESQTWENEFLADDAIRELLVRRAVVLKLQAGSTEAGYLAAIFPLPKTPTLVIMDKGQLKEYIAAGVSKEDFLARASKALGAASPEQQRPASFSAPNQPVAPAAAPSASPSAAPATAPNPATHSPSPATSTAPAPPSSQPSPQVQSLLAERAARLEAQRKKEAEQRRAEKAKAKDTPPAKPKDPAQEKYTEELKRRQQQAHEERARVLQAIEDDKAARRARREERQAVREGRESSEAPVSRIVAGGDVKKGSGQGEKGDGRCKLLIRLFDGSTLRHEFDSMDTLGKDVRGWLDQQEGLQGVGPGYGFKVILAPKPSKTFEIGEESKTLSDLGLAPSATLVLVSGAHGAAGAYNPNTGGGNVLMRFVLMILGFFTGLWAIVTGLLSTLFSTAPAPAPVQQGPGSDVSAQATGRDQGQKSGVWRLRPEGEGRNDQQFYNGNSTNFEPRKDDDNER